MNIKDSLILKSNNPLWKEIIEDKIKLRNKYFKYWSENNLFSLSWWLMLILFISLWFIWWKRVDKTRLHEIVTYGLMVSVVAIPIDIVGSEYVLWEYPNDLLPLIAPLIVTDFCILPITYMFLYQYFVDWKSFTIASVIFATFISFIAERIAVALDIYKLINWQHFYDFPMYIILALSLKWVMNKIMLKQKMAMIKKGN